MSGRQRSDIDDLVREREAAAILDVSPRTLQGWRRRGVGPRWLRLGRAVRYRRRDLVALIVHARGW